MKIGLIGYQGSGKSSLFQWLTSQASDPALAHRTQSAMATIPDARVEKICAVYQPKKVTQAALEVVDTPGLSRSHEGSAGRLAMIREAGCLVQVVAAFGGESPQSDVSNLQDDLLIADLDLVTGRLERLAEAIKKPRPDRDQLRAEREMLLPLHSALDAGQTVRSFDPSPEQQKLIRSFQLLTEKPRLIVINSADDVGATSRYDALAPEDMALQTVSLALEQQLADLSSEERLEFCREMDVVHCDRDRLLHAMMDASGQMLFFTAGDKEVRSWLLPKGDTAHVVAGNIHTDLARGFIRAEVMRCEDLIRLGSEREVKAQDLMRHEPKDYIVQEGEIITIRHN